MDKNLYTDKSIESLSPLEFTRLRPGVYCGSTIYSTQLLVEIISNAIDEFQLGHGNRIEVSLFNKGNNQTITVRDYGQGFIPNSFREDGKTILEAAFSVLNTSGKFHSDGVYEGTSLGSFGIGSKITNFLSHELTVTTYRDKKTETVKFIEGEFYERKCGDCTEPAGTTVTWTASEEFFDHPYVEIAVIKKLFNTVACLCPGLTIELKEYDNGIISNTTTYYSDHGIDDLLDEVVGNKEILKNRLDFHYEQGKYKMDMAMTYGSGYSLTLVPYVNTGLTESGPHITFVKSLFTRQFNTFARDKKWLKEKDENLTGDDIQEGMYIVFNIKAPDVAYDAQVKSRIVRIDMKPYSTALSDAVIEWLERNEKDAKSIIDKALTARKAREAAKKAKEAVRQPKEKKKQLLNLPTKLVDCWSKNRAKCELLISEGDSAAGGLVEGRDSEIQAVFPIRGKIINLFKNSDEKVFANAEVLNIIKALGLELDPKTHKLVFDEKKLRYGKIIMCCDADPDGQAIKNLLLTYFWSLCPELITGGYIYSAIPPLFRITTKKNEYIYLRDAAALEDYKLKHIGEKYAVNRNKGLGEQDASELAECLLDTNTRNVEQITVADTKKAEQLFEILMGTAVPPRREFLLKFSEEANID